MRACSAPATVSPLVKLQGCRKNGSREPFLGLTWVSRTQTQCRVMIQSGASWEHRKAEARAKTRAEGEEQGCGGRWFLHGPPGELLLLWPSGRYLSAQLSPFTLLRVPLRPSTEGRSCHSCYRFPLQSPALLPAPADFCLCVLSRHWTQEGQEGALSQL